MADYYVTYSPVFTVRSYVCHIYFWYCFTFERFETVRYIPIQFLSEIVVEAIPPSIISYEAVPLVATDLDNLRIIIDVNHTFQFTVYATKVDLLRDWLYSSKKVVRTAALEPSSNYKGHPCIGRFDVTDTECTSECRLQWMCETVSNRPKRQITRQRFICTLLRSGMCTRDVLIKTTSVRFPGITKSQILNALRRARKALREEGFYEIKQHNGCLWWVHEI